MSAGGQVEDRETPVAQARRPFQVHAFVIGAPVGQRARHPPDQGVVGQRRSVEVQRTCDSAHRMSASPGSLPLT